MTDEIKDLALAPWIF
jgi:hypothetical protein